MKRNRLRKPIILVIVGPTASGKSNLAVKLARKFNGEVISADSRQVYKGLNIGTNKITKREMRGVPHHLLDVANPREQFSASKYKKLADESLRYIVGKGRLPIVVGGTGFYIDVLTKTTLIPDVPPNMALRKKLEKNSAEKLFEMLEKKNPERAKSIDRYNKVRLIRALEIVKILGKVPHTPTVNTECLQWVYIGFKPDNRELERRIRTRLLKQLPSIIRESRKLHARGLSYRRMHQLGLEYRYVTMYLQDKLTREELIEKLYIAVRQYAKRQMTWWKRNRKIKWFGADEYKKIESYLRKKLRSKP